MKKNSPTSKTGILSLAFILISTGGATVQAGHWKEGGVQVAVGVVLILAYEYLQAQQIEESFVQNMLSQVGDDDEK